jgi:hypothetical protein
MSVGSKRIFLFADRKQTSLSAQLKHLVKHVQLKQTIQTEHTHVRFDEDALHTLQNLERSSTYVLLHDGYCEDKLYSEY